MLLGRDGDMLLPSRLFIDGRYVGVADKVVALLLGGRVAGGAHPARSRPLGAHLGPSGPVPGVASSSSVW